MSSPNREPTELLRVVEKSGKWAAQFCSYTLGGWWSTKAQAEDFAKNARPVIEAHVRLEAERQIAAGKSTP